MANSARAAAISFNTLRFVNRLESAGVSRKHAEAEAEALAEVLEVNLGALATKEDLKHLEDRMDAKFAAVDAKLDTQKKDMDAKLDAQKKDMSAMEARFEAKLDKLALQLTTRLGALMVAGLSILGVILKFPITH